MTKNTKKSFDTTMTQKPDQSSLLTSWPTQLLILNSMEVSGERSWLASRGCFVERHTGRCHPSPRMRPSSSRVMSGARYRADVPDDTVQLIYSYQTVHRYARATTGPGTTSDPAPCTAHLGSFLAFASSPSSRPVPHGGSPALQLYVVTGGPVHEQGGSMDGASRGLNIVGSIGECLRCVLGLCLVRACVCWVENLFM